MRSIAYALALLALLSSGIARAQYVPFVHYGQSDGLGNIMVLSLLQDDEGYLWAGTENGLYRYDGTTFHRYGDQQGLASPNIHALSMGPDHRVWAATPYAIYRFVAGRFVPVLPEGKISMRLGGSQLAFDGSGEPLIVSAGVLFRLQRDAHNALTKMPYFSAGQIGEKPELANILSIQFDAQGRLWAGCGKSLCRMRDGIVDEYGPAQGIPAGDWTSLHLDTSGQLWARDVDRIITIDTRRLTVVAHDLPPDSTTGISGFLGFTDGPGGDLLTRTDHDIARWHGGHWQFVEPSVENQSVDIVNVLMDRDGVLWAGSFGHGLVRSLGYGIWESWTQREGLGASVIWDIARKRDGGLLVGQNGRIDELVRGASHFTRWPRGRQPVMHEALGVVQTPDGSAWFASAEDGALYRLRPAAMEVAKEASLPTILRLGVDGEGTLWVATAKGVYALPNRPGATLAQVPGTSGFYRDLAVDAHGRMWAATRQGIFALTLRGQRKLAFSGDGVLQDFFVLSFSSANRLVAVSKNHLFSLDVSGDVATAPQRLRSPLVDDAAIQFVKWDHAGRLWVGTDSGVAVLQHDRWQKFDQSDGLIWNDTDENSFLADDDGSIWVGTSAGLSHLLNPAAALAPAPLRARIFGARYGDASIQDGASAPWTRRPLSFDIANLSFTHAGEVQFVTRLIGVDDSWSVATTPTLSYAAIAPGDYRFEAYTIDPALGLRSATVAYSVSILPPWWRSGWFYALIAVGVLLLLLLVIRINVMILVARHRKAESLAMKRRALIYRATHDALTDLLNRQSVIEHLDEAINSNAVSGTTLVAALIDLDFFKKVNDTYGHLMGDKVLRQTGRALSENSRENDVVGRYGGEEFIWIMTGAGTFDPRRLEQVCKRLAASLEVVDGCPLGITASIGAARWRCGDTVETLLERADKALYRAKNQGRNTSVMADDESSCTPA